MVWHRCTEGSPLFTGDAGSGESETRRWIIKNDWLEAIVAVPDQLFYNTGIVGYEILLTRHFYVYKPPRPLESIEADIKAIEKDIVRMLAEVTA